MLEFCGAAGEICLCMTRVHDAIFPGKGCTMQPIAQLMLDVAMSKAVESRLGIKHGEIQGWVKTF